MRYDTGNPIGPDGSSDPRDLYDTAGIADLLVNGPLGEYLSRLGVPLKSWRGIMQQVTDYLIAQGYESTYLVYGAGVVVDRQTQLVQRDGELYRVMNAADIPLTLTGTWATDAPKLQAVGNNSLRQIISNSDDPALGSAIVGLKRALIPSTTNTVSNVLSGTSISIWEKSHLITDKPDTSDPSTWDWTPAIQAALDDAGSYPSGGSVVVPIGKYRITRTSSLRWALTIPSRVELVGLGYGSHIFLDPALTGQSTVFHTIMIGTDTTPSTCVRVYNLRLVCNQVLIGGGHGSTTKYVQGIASRLDSGGGPLLYTDKITVEGCWIEDANIPVGCTKDTSIDHNTPARISAQHRRWRVRNNVIDGATNKAVELAECRNSSISDNECLNVVDGPQSILASRNISIVNNTVEYRVTGLNVSHNSRGTKLIGNTVTCIDAVNGLSALLLRTEPYADSSFMRDITISGNSFIDDVTAHNTVFAFQTRTQNVAAQMIAITVSANTFSGAVRAHDLNSLAKLEARDITFTGNTIGSLVTVSLAVDNVRQFKFGGNTVTLACSFNASDWRVVGNTFKNSLTMTSFSSGNYLTGNDTPTFSDSGANNAGIPNNDFNSAVQHIQAGNLTNSTNPTRVAFPVPFKASTIPVLAFGVQATGSSDATYANLDHTGFDLYTFAGGTAGSRNLGWVAVGVR